ncbi:MAG: ABC transporter ATP-binding protein [Haloarculaceae archaeon]
MVEVHLSGVEKAFGETTALADVSLSVADGEFFTLVGPSGCGKTTTLRLVAGFDDPTRGTVRFDDRDVAGVPPEERDVGIVFQNYALFPHMNVRENVGYGLRFREPPGGDERARVDELLDLVGLSGMGERDPTELSGGQQQRVALARALAPGPDLLLLDEPMSALDARLRERLRREIRDIQTDLGVTTIYVTHDQEEALAVSDRVAVMSDGRVQQVGTPQSVYRTPATRFVAEFVGDNNLFPGTVVGRESGRVTVDVGPTEFVVETDATPAAGESVTVCVRPEAFGVDASTNRVEGTVANAEFLGASTRVWLTWSEGELLVRTTTVPTEGRTATVGFAPDDAHLLSETARGE